MNPVKMSNILLLAGTGRNVGKTTFGCCIVSQIAVQTTTISVKISKHPHPLTDGLHQLAGDDKTWFIAEERASEGNKDSLRYRKAGAVMSLYAMANDQSIGNIYMWLRQNINKQSALVIESGSLGVLVEPGAAFFLGPDSEKQVQWNFGFVRLKSYDEINGFNLHSLTFANGSWKIG